MMAEIENSNTSASQHQDQNGRPIGGDEQTAKTKKPATPKKKRPNYNQIHSQPLPLNVHPLPAFHPSHPLSLVRLIATYLSHIIWPPTSLPLDNGGRFEGYYSSETHSVHVTNPAHVRALWEMGFFGKGSLSRSEPTWLEREEARRRQEKVGAEAATSARRDARRLFKLERARAERERIERQRLIEEGKLDASERVELVEGAADEGRVPDAEVVAVTVDQSSSINSVESTADLELIPPDSKSGRVGDEEREKVDDDDLKDDAADLPITNQEHLQLTPEEAFFLSFGLGVLSIYSSPSHDTHTSVPLSTQQLLQLFTGTHNQPSPSIPAKAYQQLTTSTFSPDDPFILNYAVYHHFRSLGWVVRPGMKFSVDYLLYNRGPVFSHAEFAVVIIPAYTAAYWTTPEGLAQRREGGIRGGEKRDWWWLHCVNRVQSQVLKTVVLCYVDVPPPLCTTSEDEHGKELAVKGEAGVAAKALLQRYKIREFILKRWIANRSRD